MVYLDPEKEKAYWDERKRQAVLDKLMSSAKSKERHPFTHMPNEFSAYAGKRHVGGERACPLCHPDYVAVERKCTSAEVESRLRA